MIVFTSPMVQVARTVDNAVLDIKSLDTNYAAVYYPWVKLTGRKNHFSYH